MEIHAKRKTLRAIYFMQMLEGIVGSLVGIFIPVFLYTLGFSLLEIFVFLIVYQISLSMGAFGAAVLARLTGFQQTFVLRLPLAYLYFFFLKLKKI